MIIGTHDSSAYKIDFSTNPFPINNKFYWANVICRLIPCLGYKIKKTSICQKYNIREQLELGVRAFDIRVSYKKGRFLTSHKFFCEYLDNILDQMKGYEDIHIFIKPAWSTRTTMDGHESELIEFLKSKLDLDKVKCYYRARDDGVLENTPIQDYRVYHNVWMNVDNVQDFKTKFEKYYRNRDLSNHVFGFTLTPRKLVNLEELTKEIHKELHILDQDNLPFILSVDFVDESFF